MVIADRLYCDLNLHSDLHLAAAINRVFGNCRETQRV